MSSKSTADKLVDMALKYYRLGLSLEREPFAVKRDGPTLAIIFRGGMSAFRAELSKLFREITGQTVYPHEISNLFYKRHLDDDRCPVVGRCRLIPDNYVSEILRVLIDRGHIVANDELGGPGP